MEGVRLVRDAIAGGASLRIVALCPALLGDAEADLRRSLDMLPNGPRIAVVDEAVMRALADTETPQGVVAVADFPAGGMAPIDPAIALLLVLDGLRDPGNIGTLLRAGAAAGCDAVVVMVGSADPYAPKVVRAAMGAHFRVPVVPDAEWDILGPVVAPLPALYGADAAASQPYDAVDWRGGAAIVIGHEDHGLSREARAMCRGTVAIPMARGVESLNAAISGAVILFEAARQRRAAREG